MKRKAQQLVEFALVLPILMIVLMVIIEIGFAINANITLTESVKMSVAKLNTLYNIDGSASIKNAAISNSIRAFIVDYFKAHNMPNSDTISVSIEDIASSDQAIVKVKYAYSPVFTLLNVYGNTIIPEKYQFMSSQLISKTLLQENNFNSTLTTEDLSSFYQNASATDERTSVLIDGNINGVNSRNQIGYLFAFSSPLYTYARLFNWYGEDLLPPNLAINLQTGFLMVKSPYYTGAWMETNIPYTWVLTSLGITNAIYIQNDVNPPFQFRKLDFSSSLSALNLGVVWCGQGAGQDVISTLDVSTSTIDNMNKRGLSFLFNTNGSAYGDYEPVNVKSGVTQLETIKNYVVSRSNYILSISVPVDGGLPADAYNGYRYSFNLNGGVLSASGTAVDIVDCYIDSDGDSIPDAWDGHPTYPDIDADGILDGNDINIATPVVSPTLPDTVTLSASADTVFVAMPYLLDGNLNSSKNVDVSVNSYTPKTYNVTIGYNTVSGYNAIYYNVSGSTYTRKVNKLATLTDKARFINGYVDGSTISLNNSTELSALQTKIFSAANKVTN